jgi:hypothetical protein
MSDQFVDFAKSQMGAIERLLKGLPGISGYIDKELRRDADKRVREGLVQALDHSRSELMDIQNRLLSGGGLLYMDDVDQAIVKLQTLSDRIKTASYGYAGLFDAVRIQEEQLDALNRFDQAMVGEIGALNEAITALSNAVADNNNIAPTASRVTKTVADLNRLYDKRRDAILSPDLLRQPDYAPPAADAAPAAPAAGSDSETATSSAAPDTAASAADIANDPNAVG